VKCRIFVFDLRMKNHSVYIKVSRMQSCEYASFTASWTQ
jgi:hypothetical protein